MIRNTLFAALALTLYATDSLAQNFGDPKVAVHQIAFDFEVRGPKFVRSLLGQSFGCKDIDRSLYYAGNAPRFQFSKFDEAILADSSAHRRVDLPYFVFLRVNNTSAFPLINFTLKQGNHKYTLKQIPGNKQFASILLAGLALREPDGSRIIEGILTGEVSGTVAGVAWRDTFSFDHKKLNGGISISCDSNNPFFFPPAK